MVWEESALTPKEVTTSAIIEGLVHNMGAVYGPEVLGELSIENYLENNSNNVNELENVPAEVSSRLGPELSGVLGEPMEAVKFMYGFDERVFEDYRKASYAIKELGNERSQIEEENPELERALEHMNEQSKTLLNYWTKHLITRANTFAILPVIKEGAEQAGENTEDWLLNYAESLTLPVEHYFSRVFDANANGIVLPDVEKMPAFTSREKYLQGILGLVGSGNPPYLAWQMGRKVQSLTEKGKLPFPIAVSAAASYLKGIQNFMPEARGDSVEEIVDDAIGVLNNAMYKTLGQNDDWNLFEKAYSSVANGEELKPESVISRMQIAMGGEAPYRKVMEHFGPFISEYFMSNLGKIHYQKDGSPQTLRTALNLGEESRIIIPGA